MQTGVVDSADHLCSLLLIHHRDLRVLLMVHLCILLIKQPVKIIKRGKIGPASLTKAMFNI